MSATRGPSLSKRSPEVRMKAATTNGTGESLDTRELLKVLTAFKKGDFSARMPVDKVGVPGKIADTLNDVFELNEKMARSSPASVPPSVKKVRLPSEPASARPRRRMGRMRGCGQCADRRPRAALDRGLARHRRGREGRPLANDGLEVDGRPLKGEFLRTARVVNTMVTSSTASPRKLRA